MKRTLKITVMALLSAILFISPVNVYSLGNSEDSQWKDAALCYPYNGQLVPAGPIKVQWKALEDDNISQYNVYLDNHLEASVSSNDHELISCEVYTTEVDSHQVKIVGVMKDGSQVSTVPVNFYVSKKGLAYANVNEVENLNASWYYNWGTAPTSGVNTSLEYVPMIWGAGNEASKLNSIKNSGFDVILGYNEPERKDESNVFIDKAVSNAVYFANSDMRVGSPAVEHLSSILETNSWFDQYMKKVNQDDIDFIAVHEYLYNVCTCTDAENAKKVAKEFLLNLQKVYDKYHKPIWITELGIANWDEYWHHYSYNCEEGKREVYEFMTYIMDGFDDMKGLNDLDFVERYAWFPFDMSSEQAGASSLFVTKSDYNNNSSLNLGELNDLGKLYRDCGNPLGYTEVPNIENATITFEKVEYTGSQLKPKATVKFNRKTLIENIDYEISYSNNINAGQGQATIVGIGKYVGKVLEKFTISRKTISNLSFSSIPVQRYTGSPVTPNIVIKDEQKTLIKDTDYTLSYSNNVLASANAKIKITGKGNYQGSITKTFEIREYPMTGVSFNKTSLTLNKGSQETLSVTFVPGNTTDNTSLRWTSTDIRVATVSENGVVTAIKPGTATITAFTTKNNIKATCTVTVK